MRFSVGRDDDDGGRKVFAAVAAASRGARDMMKWTGLAGRLVAWVGCRMKISGDGG